MTSAPRIVILGGGHAGANAAASLRQAGHDGEIVMISEEAVLPYHRPPLSKTYLKGGSTLESLYLRPAKFYETQRVEAILGARATGIDPVRKIVVLADGREITWELLILATGSVARRLDCPGAELDGVHVLRDIRDADALRSQIGAGKRLVIVGAGYVGLEVAASARELGSEVTILEREPRILSRVASISGSSHTASRTSAPAANSAAARRWSSSVPPGMAACVTRVTMAMPRPLPDGTSESRRQKTKSRPQSPRSCRADPVLNAHDGAAHVIAVVLG